MIAQNRIGFLIMLTISSACTGLTLNENNPGGDDGPSLGTYLENGSIAVDARTENVFVLATKTDLDTDVKTKRLQVAGLSDTRARTLANLGGLQDLRILFVEDGVMVMGERGVGEELIVYDKAGEKELRRVSSDARYHGTRVSRSGRFVAVADNHGGDNNRNPIHLISTHDLSTVKIPHPGDWLEMNWANTSDTLIAAQFTSPTVGGETGSVRLMSWSIDEVAANNFATDDTGLWALRGLDVTIPNADVDLLFSYSWVSVSPNDKYAVVPLLHRYPEELKDHHRLALIELATNEVKLIDNAQGPVGFTPDGSTIVSYRNVLNGDGTTNYHLLMIDPITIEERLLAEPSPGLIQFFVTRDGNFVLVGDFFGSNQLTLVDVDTGTTQKLGRALNLREFVSRPGTGELYLVDNGLFKVDLFEATVREMPQDFTPKHINRLPSSDQLVVDNTVTDKLIFLDPKDGSTIRAVRF